MAAKRAEFSERTKAEIFVRDCALCCYTGKSLWLLDYGAGPAVPPWIEHIVPASKGGDATATNGALANWYFNHVRSNRGEPHFLFQNGLPTRLAFDLFDEIPARIIDHYERFLALHWSDWHVNQAAFHIRLIAGQELDRRKDGKNWVRGRRYRSSTALRALHKWRAAIVAEDMASLGERGLLPANPSTDQTILIGSLGASRVEDLEDIAMLLLPYMKASYEALDCFRRINEREDPTSAAHEVRKEIHEHPYIVPATKALIVRYLDRMIAIRERGEESVY